MIFSSLDFMFFFLPVVFLVFFLLNRFNRELSKWFLVFCSLFFYWYGSPTFLLWFLGSVFFNFFVGNLLNCASEKYGKLINKTILILGILVDVALLGYYKYTDFFLENYNKITGSEIHMKNITLPIGISFFTFQLIAYLVDSYRGETKNYCLIDYLLFITFFPQLIVGPIVHHKDMVPQYEDEKNFNLNLDNISLGIFLFLVGSTKKLLIADSITPTASWAFNNTEALTMLEAWAASIGYTVSYYFDLSGYADMAIGLGLLFNIQIPANFNSPYRSRNFAEYWRRWHITLSKFLGDYVFRSIKKKGGTSLNFYFAIFMTFLVSGFWHGAGWTFVVWGVINGGFVIAAHMMEKAKFKMPFIIAWFLTFTGVIFTRIIFVSDNFLEVKNVLHSAFNFHSLQFSGTYLGKKYLFFIFLGLVVAFFFPSSNKLRQWFKPNKRFTAITVILFLMTMYNIDKVGDFLYFQF